MKNGMNWLITLETGFWFMMCILQIQQCKYSERQHPYVTKQYRNSDDNVIQAYLVLEAYRNLNKFWIVSFYLDTVLKTVEGCCRGNWARSKLSQNTVRITPRLGVSSWFVQQNLFFYKISSIGCGFTAFWLHLHLFYCLGKHKPNSSLSCKAW